MPVLRSRSKPSKPSGEDEVLPPPRTRSTRGKKTAKQEEVEEVTFEPKISTQSSLSTRSKRTRSKPVPDSVTEEIKPSPPSTRSTRSAKEKQTKAATSTGKSSASKRGAAQAEKQNVVELEPPISDTGRSTRAATRKAGDRKKARVRHGLESTSDEISDEELQQERSAFKLTREKLHSQFVQPLKTALDMAVCEVAPQFMAKIQVIFNLVLRIKTS